MGSGIKYTPEFRAEAVREVLDTSRPIKQVARELHIRPDTLRTWIARAKQQGLMKKKTEDTELETEVKELRKKLRDAEEENRFLKKAAAFFARDQ